MLKIIPVWTKPCARVIAEATLHALVSRRILAVTLIKVDARFTLKLLISTGLNLTKDPLWAVAIAISWFPKRSRKSEEAVGLLMIKKVHFQNFPERRKTSVSASATATPHALGSRCILFSEVLRDARFTPNN